MDTLLQIGLSNAVVATGLAVLAALAHLCRCRPALVHCLCLLVLLKLLTPPLIRVPIELASWTAEPSPPPPATPEPDWSLPAELVFVEAEPAELGPLPTVASELPAEPATAIRESSAISWPILVGSAWLAGSVLCLAISAWRIGRFNRLLRHAAPAGAELIRQVQGLAQKLGLTRCPEVWLVPGVVSPMLWTWGRSRLLIPMDLWARLGDDERATLLAHELAHLARRDHWVRYLELTATVLYWWHPALWWARGRLRDAEEQCCDAWVVWALPNSTRAYAQALLETIDFLSGARRVIPPVASAAGQFPVLKRRLTMILQETTPRRLSIPGLVAIVALGFLLLPLLPTWAQDEEPREQPAAAERKSPEQLERDKAEMAELMQQMKALQERMAKINHRLIELGAAQKGYTFRAAHAVSPPMMVPPGQAGVRVAPSDVLFLHGGAPHEREIFKAQLDVKKASVREAEIHLQAAKEKAEEFQKLPKEAVDPTELREAQRNLQIRGVQLDRARAEQREAEARLAAQPQVKPFNVEMNVQQFARPLPPPVAAALVRPVQVPTVPQPPIPNRRPETDERSRDLEKRVDMLMRELENIRRELKAEPKR